MLDCQEYNSTWKIVNAGGWDSLQTFSNTQLYSDASHLTPVYTTWLITIFPRWEDQPNKLASMQRHISARTFRWLLPDFAKNCSAPYLCAFSLHAAYLSAFCKGRIPPWRCFHYEIRNHSLMVSSSRSNMTLMAFPTLGPVLLAAICSLTCFTLPHALQDRQHMYAFWADQFIGEAITNRQAHAAWLPFSAVGLACQPAITVSFPSVLCITT